MRELGMCDMDQGIDDTFSDIAELEACCKFSDCRHETEPGCAIRAAIADGILSRDRYELYRSLHEESRHAAKMKDISKWRKQLKNGDKKMNKVFIVEDDAVIARAVAAHLTTWQMQVQCAGNFEKITEEVEDFQPDIIIMDIKLPYYNGFYWCAEIRKTSKVPIVFLSSADDNMNIVMAMNMGGDDFIAKPFDLQVLTAKLQAVLRRSYGSELASHSIECGEVVLNLNDTSAAVRGEKIDLTKNEFLILKTLMENREKW